MERKRKIDIGDVVFVCCDYYSQCFRWKKNRRCMGFVSEITQFVPMAVITKYCDILFHFNSVYLPTEREEFLYRVYGLTGVEE